ncbi:hypothetical protein MOQ_002151 [Trypanosoma cruzi marinkellei]|uniref:Uncharacterized protein n=1 Tax=Trypanosoma cruzi marinkellei TaxID=85056 RepID=K2MQW4_TRYCR|nr:hypothetical protein MOQ_002151 [Trypanosoma cruzi marinkellei]
MPAQCGQIPFGPPMGIPMQAMLMTKGPDPALLSTLFTNGTIPPPAPPPPPPPPSSFAASLVTSLQQPKQQHQPQQQNQSGMPLPMPKNTRVSVGNASLAALVSKEPPKFSCVLLSGVPAVGKTTMGRELVNELRRDGLGWIFFSGADFIAGTTAKRPVWETTKEIFDALQKRLDELLEQQRKERNVKGLVIDKNVKGIEDVYYLASLLKARQIPFVGIVGMEVNDDNVLLKRMNGGEEMREKIKYHRVIHARVRALAKAAGMYRGIDAAKSKEEVLNALCTMVLGCCAQPPQRGIRTDLYVGSTAATMVDDHVEYCDVVTRLLELVKPPKGVVHYPGTTDYTPFSTREMSDKNRVAAIKAYYGVRRLNDGTRHMLMYHDAKLYLIPTHLKAVLRMPEKAWLGTKLDSIGCFVLEGDLVRLPKERNYEKFLVFDVFFWSDAGKPEENKLAPMNWADRQAFLATHMCAESKAFFSTGSDCVVVHQPTLNLETIVDLLNSTENTSEGILFQPINPAHGYDKLYVWRPPSNITVDFRIGTLLSTKTDTNLSENDAKESAIATTAALVEEVTATNGVDKSPLSHPAHQTNLQPLPADLNQATSTLSASQCTSSTVGAGRSAHSEGHTTRTFELEVYDKYEKEYTQFEDCTVEVKHLDVVEGCICTCVLSDEKEGTWKFQRIRYDVLRPAYKRDVTFLLEHCIIPKAKLLQWLTHEKIVPPTTNDTSAMRTPAPPLPSPGSAPLKSPTRHSASLPTYATALMFQKNNAQSHAPMRMSAPSADGISYQSLLVPGSLTRGSHLHGVPSPPHSNVLSNVHSSMHTLADSKTETPKPGNTALDSSALSPLQLLTTMVSSVHIVRTEDSDEKHKIVSTANPRRNHNQQEQRHSLTRDRDRRGPNTTNERDRNDKRGNNRTSRQEKTHGGKKVLPVPDTCTQCLKKKQAEDLRLDKEDNNYYCYSCWAKLGWEFCRECGEFNKGYRERTRRRIGEFYCNNCWSNFNKGEEEEEGGRKQRIRMTKPT